jgi:DNA-binding response OmpR family regulator
MQKRRPGTASCHQHTELILRTPLVLLAEDEALIALALVDDLEAAGYRVAGPFHRCDNSLQWLEQETPDVAIIDVHLRDKSSVELARMLRERDVPFLVFSGDRRDGRSHDAFDGGRWLSKPVSGRQLLETLGELAEPGIPAGQPVMVPAGAYAPAV